MNNIDFGIKIRDIITEDDGYHLCDSIMTNGQTNDILINQLNHLKKNHKFVWKIFIRYLSRQPLTKVV